MNTHGGERGKLRMRERSTRSGMRDEVCRGGEMQEENE